MAGYFNEGVLVEWDEDREPALIDRYKVWILDPKQTLRCFTPFDLWMLQQNYDNHGIPYAHDYLSVPTCKGFDSKIKDGWVYQGSILTTEEERREREPKFKEKIKPWTEDPEKLYREGIDELMERYKQFKAIEMENLEDWELKDAFEAWLAIYRRNANLHFIWMVASAIVYVMFEDSCKELIGIDKHDLLFNDLMGGFDHKLLETDRGLFQLATKAKEMGLESLFNETEDKEELLSKLEYDEQGKDWTKELREFMYEYGWRTIGNWDAGNPSWEEKPSQVFPTIKKYMQLSTFPVDEAQPKLIERREKAKNELISRVPDDKRGNFSKLLRAAQWCNYYSDEHVFYCENYGNALGRKVTKEIGKRFAKAGIINAPQDVYYMLPEEIDIRITSQFNAKKLVETRKKQHEGFRAAEMKPFIGDPTKIPEVIANSPMLAATVAPFPRVRPELKADLYGTVSTPGVFEGVVNVIMSEEDFGTFRPGEILVTVETSAAWTPLFSMAKAVVTDTGGILSHSAIIGREYGLPVISGCMEGTKKLKTGMKVRVDGDEGVVYILDN
jgi:phosphohistidine swiveling domain-containing protein